MSGPEWLFSICVLLLLVGLALIWRAVSRSPRPGRDPSEMRPTLSDVKPRVNPSVELPGWVFVVAGPCLTGQCDCREYAGLVIEHGGALPPRHEGCSCYFEAPD
jgi:hypothetical protein